MIVVRDIQSLPQINNSAIRQLVQQRIDDLCVEGDDIHAMGYFVIMEPDDTVEVIQEQIGFNILSNRLTGDRYDDPMFTASFEFILEYPSCYEIVFVLDDSGFGVELFIPKITGVEPDLTAMCQKFAIKPSTSGSP